MILSSQRTLFAVDLEQHRSFNVPYTPLVNTTLNERFDVATSVTPASNVYPYVNTYIIGVGGNSYVEGSNKLTYSQHTPMDGCLFEPIPFVIREVSSDLDATQRENYRLRVIETINNNQYVCYYGKVIPTPNITQLFYKISTIQNNVNVSSPVLTTMSTNVSEILRPVPKNRIVNYSNLTSLDYITKINKLEFNLSLAELNDIKSVMEIKGISNKVLTELGICTSIPYELNGYKEAVYAQVAYHLEVNFELLKIIESGEKIQAIIELGGFEPLIY